MLFKYFCSYLTIMWLWESLIWSREMHLSFSLDLGPVDCSCSEDMRVFIVVWRVSNCVMCCKSYYALDTTKTLETTVIEINGNDSSQVLLSAAQVVLQFNINIYRSETFPRTITHQMVSNGLFGVCDMTTLENSRIKVMVYCFPMSGGCSCCMNVSFCGNKCEWRASCESGRWIKTCDLMRTLTEEPVPLSFT